jgi:hypothetical protein
MDILLQNMNTLIIALIIIIIINVRECGTLLTLRTEFLIM